MSAQRQPDPEVFLKAAELCSDPEGYAYCCTSLYAAAAVLHGLSDDDRRKLECVEGVAFHCMFLPVGVVKGSAYFGTACPGEPSTAANTERRVFALLLAAEILRDPDNRKWLLGQST